jgi:hypothetical protein
VSVSEGGQAIVGNVTQAARESAPEKAAKASPALSHSKEPRMTIIDGERERAPWGCGNARKAAVLDARRCTRIGGTARQSKRSQARIVSREAIEERRQVQALIRRSRRLVQEIE